MRKAVVILSLLVICGVSVTAASQPAKPPFENDAHLIGVLHEEMYWGPPNFGEDKLHDTRTAVPILVLTQNFQSRTEDHQLDIPEHGSVTLYFNEMYLWEKFRDHCVSVVGGLGLRTIGISDTKWDFRVGNIVDSNNCN